MRMLNGRRGLAATAAIALLVAVAVAGIASAGEGPVKVKVGELEFIADGGFKPTVLSKTKLTPIAFEASGTIKSLNPDPKKRHPPALKEVLVEADKNTAVTTKGYPTCKSAEIQSTTTAAALATCKSALIGEGKTHVGIAFPESEEVPVKSRLLVFNGGEKGGTITYFIHAYITVPVPAAIVTTVKIKKIHHGRYGLLAVATIPKIAGGAGSVLDFSLKIDKKFTYKGKQVSVISAKCPDGKLQAHATAIFADGTHASAEVIRSCTGKG
jgi:hypothetical protein